MYIIKLNKKIMCYTEFHLTHRIIIYRYILIEKVDVKFVIWTSNLTSNFLIGIYQKIIIIFVKWNSM